MAQIFLAGYRSVPYHIIDVDYVPSETDIDVSHECIGDLSDRCNDCFFRYFQDKADIEADRYIKDE